MKHGKSLVLIAALLATTTVHADTVTGDVLDTMPGKGMGGMSGFLIAGFASGGPAGALLGGGLGWFLGEKVQETIGVGDTAYQVRTSDGKDVTVRSPRRFWSPGDEVRIEGNRLVAVPAALDVSQR